MSGKFLSEKFLVYYTLLKVTLETPSLAKRSLERDLTEKHSPEVCRP